MIHSNYAYKIVRPGTKKRKRTDALVFLLLFPLLVFAQQWDYPLIKGYGGIQFSEEIAEPFVAEERYQLLFDITSEARKGGANRSLWRVARTLNLLAASSVPQENIEIVVALHGGATKMALSNEAYQSLFQKNNPDVKLLEILAQHKVRFFVCSQAMIARSYPLDQLHPNVKAALSALTVVANYQKKGYILMP